MLELDGTENKTKLRERHPWRMGLPAAPRSKASLYKHITPCGAPADPVLHVITAACRGHTWPPGVLPIPVCRNFCEDAHGLRDLPQLKTSSRRSTARLHRSATRAASLRPCRTGGGPQLLMGPSAGGYEGKIVSRQFWFHRLLKSRQPLGEPTLAECFGNLAVKRWPGSSGTMATISRRWMSMICVGSTLKRQNGKIVIAPIRHLPSLEG